MKRYGRITFFEVIKNPDGTYAVRNGSNPKIVAPHKFKLKITTLLFAARVTSVSLYRYTRIAKEWEENGTGKGV